MCVRGRERVRGKGDAEGEDEKTWGASFDAVNVQIYVEGQWSTFIKSSFHPARIPAHITRAPPPHPATSPAPSPTGFFSPFPPPLLLHSLPVCQSQSFLPSRLPPSSLPLPSSSSLICLPCSSCGESEIVVVCSN